MGSIVEHRYIGDRLMLARSCGYEADFPAQALRDWQFGKDNPIQCPACYSTDVYSLITIFSGYSSANWWCHECKLVWSWLSAVCLTCGRPLGKHNDLLACSWCGEQWEEATILSAFNNDDEWSEVNINTKRRSKNE